jgi:hypothetical protein
MIALINIMWFLQVEHSDSGWKQECLKGDLNSVNSDAGELCTFHCIMCCRIYMPGSQLLHMLNVKLLLA